MLKDSQIAKDISVADKLLKQLENSLSIIHEKIEQDDKEGLVKELFNYENISEKAINNARLLPIVSGLPKAREMIDDIIVSENDVKISYTKEGWFYVKIPSLLPKKEKGDPSYIRATLNSGMKKFFKTHKRNKYEEDMVIIFKHNYSKERTYREYRDHDNIELNAIVDMIALHVLIDDSPMKLKHFYCSCIEDDDSTEIFLIPSTDFKIWLTNYRIGG